MSWLAGSTSSPRAARAANTPDVDGPITYELMANDTFPFLEAVVGEPAHLVGHSDNWVDVRTPSIPSPPAARGLRAELPQAARRRRPEPRLGRDLGSYQLRSSPCWMSLAHS
jgi:hypothetical protein